jgi:hypothetical protein
MQQHIALNRLPNHICWKDVVRKIFAEFEKHGTTECVQLRLNCQHPLAWEETKMIDAIGYVRAIGWGELSIHAALWPTAEARRWIVCGK